MNHNGLRETLACLESFFATNPSPQELVLIDNASQDGSRRGLIERYGAHPGITLLFLDQNRGYSGGMNHGIAYLMRNKEIKTILLLNNDTLARADFLTPLMECLQDDSGSHIVSPKILYADGRTVWSSGERVFYPLLLSMRSRGMPDGPSFDIPRKINSVTGCAMVVTREVFETIGLFDEHYFAYVEEIDFCKRARDAGFGIAYCPNAVILHRVARSLGEFSPGVMYLKARNKAYFFKKHMTPLLCPVSGSWYFLILGTWILRAVLRSQPAVIRAVLRGFLDFARGKMGPPTWAQRIQTKEEKE